MAIKRLMRQTRTVLLVPCVEINGLTFLLSGTAAAPVLTPFAVPTSAALNTWAAIRTSGVANAQVGGNISEAILDNLNLGLGASATDSTLLITSRGNEVTPTLAAVNAVMGFMRDLDQLANGAFNLAWQLVRVADIRYVIVDRVQGGKDSKAAFAAGDVISMYTASTDNGIDNAGDQAFTTLNATFVPDGLINSNYTLLS